MRIIHDKRSEFIYKMDDQDRLYKVREGPNMLDTRKMNPHKVQMYSLEEIWKAVLARLVKLDVLRDPDDDSEGEDNDSTDLEDDFDFVAKAQKRVGKLLKEKRTKKAKHLALIDAYWFHITSHTFHGMENLIRSLRKSR